MQKLFFTLCISAMSCEMYPMGEVWPEDVDVAESSQCVLNGIQIENQELSEDYGWSVVGLGSEGADHSGGTGILIAPNLVLTSGHGGTSECSDMTIQRHWEVRIGSDSRCPLERIKVVKEIEHPDYGRNNPNVGKEGCAGGWGVDLGIWVLEHPPIFAKPHEAIGKAHTGDIITLLGFGAAEQEEDHKGPLRSAKAMIAFHTIDALQGNPSFPNGGDRFYLDMHRDYETEGGDSGGPYFNEAGELVAIHSGSTGQRAQSQAVSPYLDWINKVIEDNK